MTYFCDYCDSGKNANPETCKRDSPLVLDNDTYCGFGNLEGLEVANQNGTIEFRETGRKAPKNSKLKLIYAIVEAEESLREKGKSPRPKPEKSVLCGLYNLTQEEVDNLKEKILMVYNKIQIKNLP